MPTGFIDPGVVATGAFSTAELTSGVVDPGAPGQAVPSLAPPPPSAPPQPGDYLGPGAVYLDQAQPAAQGVPAVAFNFGGLLSSFGSGLRDFGSGLSDFGFRGDLRGGIDGGFGGFGGFGPTSLPSANPVWGGNAPSNWSQLAGLGIGTGVKLYLGKSQRRKQQQLARRIARGDVPSWFAGATQTARAGSRGRYRLRF